MGGAICARIFRTRAENFGIYRADTFALGGARDLHGYFSPMSLTLSGNFASFSF